LLAEERLAGTTILCPNPSCRRRVAVAETPGVKLRGPIVLKVSAAALLLLRLAFPFVYLLKTDFYLRIWGLSGGTISAAQPNRYALAADHPAALNGIVLTAFSWPVVFVTFLLWRKPKFGVVAPVAILELSCLAGTVSVTVFVLWLPSLGPFSMRTRFGPGAYLAFVALTLYGFGAIWADVVALGQKIGPWRRETGRQRLFRSEPGRCT
jgi:hypothetical protein